MTDATQAQIIAWLRDKAKAELAKCWSEASNGCMEYADAWEMAADAIERGDCIPKADQPTPTPMSDYGANDMGYAQPIDDATYEPADGGPA